MVRPKRVDLVRDRRAVVSVLICALLFFVVLKVKWLSLVLIFFSNIFFTAYSDAKILIFFVYAGLLFLAFRLFHPKKLNGKRYFIIISLLLLTLSFASLGSYVYIQRSFGLPLQRTSSFVYGDGFDTTVGLFHIHTLKPAFTWPLTLLGIKSLYYYGSGLTFFQAFAQLRSFYILSSVLLLITALLLIRYGIYLGRGRGVGFLWVYAIFSYGTLKALIDGGPLWYEAYLNFALLIILLRWPRRSNLLSIRTISLFFLSCLAGIYAVMVGLQAFVSNIYNWDLFRNRPIVQYALFFSGMSLVLFVIDGKKYRWLIGICLVLGIFLHSFTPTTTYIRYASKVIPRGKAIYLLTNRELALPLVASEGLQYLYRFTEETNRTVFSALAEYSQLFWQNLTAEDVTYSAQTPLTSSVLYLKVFDHETRVPMGTHQSPFFEALRVEEAVAVNGGSYAVHFQYYKYLPDFRTALIAHFREIGLRSFVLFR